MSAKLFLAKIFFVKGVREGGGYPPPLPPKRAKISGRYSQIPTLIFFLYKKWVVFFVYKHPF